MISEEINFIEAGEIANNDKVVIFLTYQPEIIAAKVHDALNGTFNDVDEEENEEVNKSSVIFDNKDSFIFAENVINGYEKSLADMFDDLAIAMLKVYN
jgi:hypothetical protein